MKFIKRLRLWWTRKFFIHHLKRKYADRPYKELYASWVNHRAKIDPKIAVGGMWEEIGKLQFNFLLEDGLKPHHLLLDLGCGSLRGGIHFIRYLKAGNYFGMDISNEILKAGKKILYQYGLEHKHPTLIHNIDLSFRELRRKQFDYVIAQSVFTHMPLSDIEECFQNVKKILKKNGIFFATFNESSSIEMNKTGLTFYYPLKVLTKVANKHNLNAKKIREFNHPRGQKMLRLTRKQRPN